MNIIDAYNIKSNVNVYTKDSSPVTLSCDEKTLSKNANIAFHSGDKVIFNTKNDIKTCKYKFKCSFFIKLINFYTFLHSSYDF